MTMKRDICGELIWPDFCEDSAEGIAAWNTLARLSVEEGLAFYCDQTGSPVDEPVIDPAGRILFRIIEQVAEEKPAPHQRTIADVRTDLDPNDAFDCAIASLPIFASQIEKVKAALLANNPGDLIQARLQCSGSLVHRARNELRAELPESEWPESLRNPRSLAKRGRPRKDISSESGNSLMQRRARDLGVSEAEARQIAVGNRNKTKFKEHNGAARRRVTGK